MTIQRIFSLQPAVLPNEQPDRTAIALRSLFIGSVVTCVAFRVTQKLSLRIAAPLTASLFTYCFESWRARRASGFPTDLEGQNALCLTLIDPPPEKWVEIWNELCRLPELIVNENALLAETMEKVFLGVDKPDRAAHLLEPFLQGNDQLITYLETHRYFPMMEAAHAAKARIATAIAERDSSTTGKLLREPFMSEFNKMSGFQFDCWTSVRDAEIAQVLKEAKMDPNQSPNALTNQLPLQYIAQNTLSDYTTEFTACDHASALIEAGATGIVEAILLCKDRDHLAGWMASYCFYQDPWSYDFAEFYKTMNRGHFVGLLDRSCHVDDATILGQSEELWKLFCKFNCPSNNEDSLFMRLLHLNTDKLPEWLAQAVSQNCPEVVEALFKSGKLNVSELKSFKKRRCWIEVGDIQTARLLQANGLDVNEDLELIKNITRADSLRLVLACGRNKGIVNTIDTWEKQAEKAPLVAILDALLFWHIIESRLLTNLKAVTLEIYKEICLLSEYEPDEAIWRKINSCWQLICTYDDGESRLFKRIVDHSSEKKIVERFDIAIRSKAPKVVSALLKSGKIQVKVLSHEQQRNAWCGIRDADTALILKDHGFRLAEMSKEEVLAMFEDIVKHEMESKFSFKEQFQLLINQGARVDEPEEGWDVWIEKIQDRLFA